MASALMLWSWAALAAPQALELDDQAITNLGISRSPTASPILIKPRLKLHCPNSICSGVRYFDSYQTQKVPLSEKWTRIFLHYSCANCRTHSKIFAIMARWNTDIDEGEAIKVGEWPPFGPKISAKVISILGENKDLFLMGRRSEIQGLGIGALAYCPPAGGSPGTVYRGNAPRHSAGGPGCPGAYDRQ